MSFSPDDRDFLIKLAACAVAILATVKPDEPDGAESTMTYLDNAVTLMRAAVRDPFPPIENYDQSGGM